MEGFSNEVAHFIYDYDPAWHSMLLRRSIKTKLRYRTGIRVFEINLTTSASSYSERNVWEWVPADIDDGQA